MSGTGSSAWFAAKKRALVHGTPGDVVACIGAYGNLDHVRLSDLSSSGGGRGGGIERLLTIVSRLHPLP